MPLRSQKPVGRCAWTYQMPTMSASSVARDRGLNKRPTDGKPSWHNQGRGTRARDGGAAKMIYTAQTPTGPERKD
jgi:hypothetical protein